ncbi:hypothetical protein D3C84_690910 [compost metagenome]
MLVKLQCHTSKLVCTLLFCAYIVQAKAHFSFQSYHDEQLYMSLVTSSTQGEMLLSKGNKIFPLHGAVLDNMFTARVRVPCEQLNEPTTLYWSVKGAELQSADIPSQRCTYSEPPLPPIQVLTTKARCLINTRGNTLWRTASELVHHNGATVYQNIYALFISNRSAFEDGDIHRLREQILHCPPPVTFRHITPKHARSLFSEAESFRKASHLVNKPTLPPIHIFGEGE